MAVEKLLTVKQAAALLGISASTLYGRAAQGLVPRVVLWKGQKKECVRFSPSDLDRYIRGNSHPSKSGHTPSEDR
jgi:excisionase family DNA binding protein